MLTVLQRRLARELTVLREEAGYAPREVAELLGWSRPKVSRIETARSVPRVADVEALLSLYLPDPAQALRLIDLTRQARQRGWWTAFTDVLAGSYVSLEDGAGHIRTWQAQLVPDLLQTEAYARQVIAAAHPDPAEITHRRVQARMARRAVLGRDSAPRFHAILDEAVLHREIGGAEVMEPQFVRLLTMGRQPHVTLQVLPFAAGAHAGLNGSFALLGFPDPDEPEVGYAEGQSGEVQVDAPEQVARMRRRWTGLVEAALSPSDSMSLIAERTGE